jgi:hypothetical protein
MRSNYGNATAWSQSLAISHTIVLLTIRTYVSCNKPNGQSCLGNCLGVPFRSPHDERSGCTMKWSKRLQDRLSAGSSDLLLTSFDNLRSFFWRQIVGYNRRAKANQTKNITGGDRIYRP